MFNYVILPILISALAIATLLRNRKKIPRSSFLFSFWVSGLVFFSTYILLILIARGLDAYYWSEYMSFDMNNDGYIEESERTAGYSTAHENAVNDTARNMVFMTGAIISLLVSTTVLFVGVIGNFLIQRRNTLKKN
ncbi:hypothetical protein [Lutimonas sp.]|uniref:hypothetical protein n=1 Tax=Lutimonas sp. TaxID=1872403 RepID=UPI003D9B45EC